MKTLEEYLFLAAENAFEADSPLSSAKSPLEGNREDMMYKLSIMILAHHANLVLEKLGDDAHIDFLNEIGIDVSCLAHEMELTNCEQKK